MKNNKVLSADLIDDLIPKAIENPRRRINHNIHSGYNNQVQRFLNVLDYNSYVRPHSHNKVNAWEGFVIMRGELSVFQFDEKGSILKRTVLSDQGPIYGIELDSTASHCITSLSDQVVIFEYKEGPYEPDNDKTFSQWSPEEGSEESQSFNLWLKHAQQGEMFPSTKQ